MLQALPYIQIPIPYPINFRRLMDNDASATILYLNILETCYMERSCSITIKRLRQRSLNYKNFENLLKVIFEFGLICINHDTITITGGEDERMEVILKKRKKDRERKKLVTKKFTMEEIDE